jgi:endonuclease YncB( thermonuclease family)
LCLNLNAQYCIDGDTFIYNNIKYRLSGIDCPEKSQPFGQEAKKELIKLIQGKELIIVAEKIDRYGRVIATIYVGTTDINKELVSKGFAWSYRRYSSKYNQTEETAKKSKKGMWRYNNNINPEKFRHEKNKQNFKRTYI